MTQLRIAMILLACVELTAADPHRPPCSTPECRKVQAFVRLHYCVPSGPRETGCRNLANAPSGGVIRVASYSCERIGHCSQMGRAPAEIRTALIAELRGLGVAHAGAKEVNFKVLKSKATGWSLADAYYTEYASDFVNRECQVVAMFDPEGHAFVIRKLRLQKVNVEKRVVVNWEPLDLRDIDGDGQPEAVLKGWVDDENWLEVHEISAGVPNLIFSGFGAHL